MSAAAADGVTAGSGGTASTVHTYACPGPYHVTVTSGPESAACDVLIATVKLGAPADLAVSTTELASPPGEVVVSWTPPDNADGATLTATPAQGPVLTGTPLTAASATFTGVIPGQTYTWQVTATSTDCDYSPSDPVSGTWCSPTAPSALAASGVTNTGFTLSWAASPGAGGYNLTAQAPDSALPPQSVTATTATFTGAKGARLYACTVGAWKTGCLSTAAALNVPTAWDAPTPGVPTGITGSGFTVPFTATADQSGTAPTVTATATATGHANLAGTVGASSAVFAGADSGVTYTVVMQASGGQWPVSAVSTVNVTTTSKLPAPTVAKYVCDPKVYEKNFQIAVQCASTGATSYTVTSVPALTWTGSGDTYSSTGAVSGTSYAVTAVAHAAGSQDSDPGTLTLAKLPMPADPTIQNLSATGFTATWPLPSGADKTAAGNPISGQNIQTGAAMPDPTFITAADPVSWSYAGLSASTQYGVSVWADSTDPGKFWSASAVAQVTTSAAPKVTAPTVVKTSRTVQSAWGLFSLGIEISGSNATSYTITATPGVGTWTAGENPGEWWVTAPVAPQTINVRVVGHAAGMTDSDEVDFTLAKTAAPSVPTVTNETATAWDASGTGVVGAGTKGWTQDSFGAAIGLTGVNATPTMHFTGAVASTTYQMRLANDPGGANSHWSDVTTKAVTTTA